MDFQLLIFDIAGTTVVDKGDINESFRNAFLRAGFHVDAAAVDQVMGYRKIDAIKIILDKYNHPVTPPLINSIHDNFTNSMVEFYANDPDLKPMPFAEELFVTLKTEKVKVALNTGFTKIITDVILTRLGWHNPMLIDAVASSDEVPEGRPQPFMIAKIMQQLGVSSAHSVVKVGDTGVDVEEGRNAGCGLVVAVTTGAFERTQLEKYNPDHIIDSLQQLPALIH